MFEELLSYVEELLDTVERLSTVPLLWLLAPLSPLVYAAELPADTAGLL